MLQRQKLNERCQIHSIHFSFTRGKICTQATSLRSLVPKEKSLDTWPPDFDACEVDLDMQMSFLNAVPFLTKCSLTCLSIRRGGIPRVLRDQYQSSLPFLLKQPELWSLPLSSRESTIVPNVSLGSSRYNSLSAGQAGWPPPPKQKNNNNNTHTHTKKKTTHKQTKKL